MDDLGRRVLTLDDEHPTHTRTKEAIIRKQLGISPARYYQIRNRLLTDPEALAEFPLLPRRVEAEQARDLRALLGRDDGRAPSGGVRPSR